MFRGMCEGIVKGGVVVVVCPKKLNNGRQFTRVWSEEPRIGDRGCVMYVKCCFCLFKRGCRRSHRAHSEVFFLHTPPPL